MKKKEYKITVSKFFKHLHLVNRHRFKVFCLCFRAGEPLRGLLHDLSKYGPEEFFEGVKYYEGNYSPIRNCKIENGYSKAWIHHIGRNKHHYEYWFDFSIEHQKYMPIKIPINYVKEMICDRIAASKVYLKDKYTKSSALEYFNRTSDGKEMHPETCTLLKSWLELVADLGENEAIKIIKKIKEY